MYVLISCMIMIKYLTVNKYEILLSLVLSSHQCKITAPSSSHSVTSCFHLIYDLFDTDAPITEIVYIPRNLKLSFLGIYACDFEPLNDTDYPLDAIRQALAGNYDTHWYKLWLSYMNSANVHVKQKQTNKQTKTKTKTKLSALRVACRSL